MIGRRLPSRVAASLLLAGTIMLPACGNGASPGVPTRHTEESPMNTPANDRPSRSSSRMRAPEVASVEHNGVRYTQLQAPSSEGLPPGGYVVATAIASGKRLWIARLYETAIDPRRETDVQIVFLRSMTLAPAGDALLITDEKNRNYAVQLSDGAVRNLP